MSDKHRTLTGLLSAAALAIMVIAPAAVGADEAKSKLLSVTPDGRVITFNDSAGNKVKSKVSGSRTKVMIGGKKTDRENLKAGMTCDISYKKDGKKNEPSMLSCM